MSGRISHECPRTARHSHHGFPCAADRRRPTDRRAMRLVAVRVCLPGTLRERATRLLFQPSAQPLLALTATQDSRSRRSPAWSVSSRPTASHQQGVSSKEASQAAHHRMAGRPHGKLLPRYAGPIAEFMLTHADATRLLMFSTSSSAPGECVCRQSPSTTSIRSLVSNGPRVPRPPPLPGPAWIVRPPSRGSGETMPPSQPVPLPPPPLFSRRGRNSRGAFRLLMPQASWTGWPRPKNVSQTRTAPCGRAC